MPLFHAILLGIVQGLTEPLPISSSAHLILIPWIFSWRYQGLSFDVALHLGTALAFGIYFFKDWTKIIQDAFAKQKSPQKNLLWYIFIATLPAIFAGLLFEEKIEGMFRSPMIIAIVLSLFGIILLLADRFGKKDLTIEYMDLKSSIVIGLAQSLALIPGVSRSGITITAGLFKGFSRHACARFSFLLSTPIVCAAGLYKLRKLQLHDLNLPFFAGVMFSAITGYIGIHFLLHFIKKSSFNVFVIYRILVSIAVVIIVFVK